MKKNALPAALLLAAVCHTANAEEWICGMWEDPPSKSSFDYDITLDNSPTARVEVTPTTLGANPRDNAEAGTSNLLILRNSSDGLVLAAGGTGPTQYGRAVYGSLLVLNRQTKTALQSYALSAEKAGFVNPPRMGKCTLARP
ncbi:hypothetical protein HDG34_003595 [Paraburkholderia sp. HC6.4b]|uniref:hypothetical protein n=1 Tax=unclassified Paraburkholderia TaxID=2615204 RepID=UPI00161FBAC0|nr:MULTISPECIES: hypothetical protein [unclassified Paraburkholderia]MBB5409653.1 hypothetical protein [Paraburkholderia sp. HC6.4b]MBB5451382.1 hypothetical protein [Paraburkholderia sp. Kb1A]